jgi:hypothetical protein
VPAKKKGGPLKIVVPKAKSGMKRPSDIELTLAKPVKKRRKFVLDVSAVPASGQGDAGAYHLTRWLPSQRKSQLLAKGQRIHLVSMLGAASPTEPQESSPHDPVPKTLEGAPVISVEPAAPSATADATTSLRLVTTTAGGQVSASVAFTPTSTGYSLVLRCHGFATMRRATFCVVCSRSRRC